MEYLKIKEDIRSKLPEKVDFDGSKNLLELGLNSLQIMRLINQWRKCGIRVSFGELMENPTLDKWWNIINDKEEDTTKEINTIEEDNRPFKLTDVQYSYFIGRKDDTILGGVGCHAYLEFDGENVQVEKLKKAWNTIQYHHSMLRAKFLDDGTQVIMEKPYSEEISVNYLQNESNIDKKLLEIREILSHKKLDVEKGEVAGLTLSLLPENKTRVHFNVDLLVADVQSIQIILRDLALVYKEKYLILKKQNWSFKSYLKSKDKEENNHRKEAKIYWQNHLRDLTSGPELPLKKRPEEIKVTKFNRRKMHIKEVEWDKLKRKAAKNKTTPAMMLLTAYSLVLERYSTTKNFIINIPIFNRDTKYEGIEDVVSDFTTLLLLQTDCTGNPSFLEMLKRVQKQFNNDMKYSMYSGVQVQRDLCKLRGMQQNIAPIVFSCNLGTPLVNNEFKECIGKVNYMISQTPQVWLDFQTYEDEGNLIIAWDSVDELFPENLIDRMIKCYEKLIYHIINETLESKFDLLCDDQKKFIENECNIENTKPRCIHDAFLKKAKEYPEKIALIDTKENIVMTYNEIKEKALSIAAGIMKLDIIDSPIAITLESGYKQIVSALGILISGNYYVPVSIGQPQERRKLIYEKTGINYCITEKTEENFNVKNLIFNELINEKPTKNIPNVSPEKSAYIIMTSGSTGIPKGVEISHYNAWNTIEDINNRYNVNKDDSVLCVSSMEFDLSVYDVFGLLGSGGKLVLIPEEERRNAEYWITQIEKYKITIWNSVPILMQMLLVAVKAKKLTDLSLRLVLLSGDWIPMDLPRELFNIKKECTLVALGGATEASIWSNHYEVPQNIPKEWKSIPYGRPLRGQVYRVIDDYGRDCPYYVKGELIIGGIGVAKGYRGDVELTADRFFKENNIKWYKTGDIGAIWEDGTIEFIGRKDSQVKLKGHRIELGEVESAIKKINGIKDCVAVLIKKVNSIKILTAVVVVENNDINESNIRSILKEKIPEYMIPAQIFVSNSLEITKNGKRDRKLLKKWIEDKIKNNSTKETLEVTNMQSQILDIWNMIFNKDNISIEDNYFTIGGDSLIAIRLIAALKDKFNISVPLNCIFENNTVKLLANKIEKMLSHNNMQTNFLIDIKHNEDLRYEEFDTTEIQYAYWIGRQGIYPLGNVSSYCYYEIECENVDIVRLNKTWQKIIEKHDALRTVFSDNGKTQHVLRKVPQYEFEINDCFNLSYEEKINSINEFRRQMSQQVITSSKWPLFDIRVNRWDNHKSIIHIGIDNLIMDARSVLHILNEWSCLYKDENSELKSSEYNFSDYIYSISKLKNSEVYKRDKKYWLDRIENFPKTLKLPVKIDPVNIDKQTTIRYSKTIMKTILDKVKIKAKLYNVTVSSILISIYAIVLAEYSKKYHYSINITVDRRLFLSHNLDDVAGDFTSTLLLEVNLIPGKQFISFVKEMQQQLMNDISHNSYSGIEFARELNKSMPDSILNNIVFTSTLGMENKNSDLFGNIKYNITQTPQVWIDCQIQEYKDFLYINWDFVKELFEEKFISQMFNKYIEYINYFINDENFEILSNNKFLEGTI